MPFSLVRDQAKSSAVIGAPVSGSMNRKMDTLPSKLDFVGTEEFPPSHSAGSLTVSDAVGERRKSEKSTEHDRSFPAASSVTFGA